MAVQERARHQLTRVLSCLLVLGFAAERGEAEDYFEVVHERLLVVAPGQKQAELIARNLLYMEHALVTLTGLTVSRSMPRTNVICLAREHWASLPVDDHEVDGEIRALDTGGITAVLSECRPDRHRLRMAYIGYARNLISHSDRAEYPLWYRVGFMELMSATEIFPPSLVSVGSIPIVASPSIRKRNEVPASELFETTDWRPIPFEERVLRHGRAWTLVQYAVVNGRETQNRLNAMAAVIVGGSAPEEALRLHFDADYEGLDRLLNKHLRTRPMTIRLTVPADLGQRVPQATPIPPERFAEGLKSLRPLLQGK